MADTATVSFFDHFLDNFFANAGSLELSLISDSYTFTSSDDIATVLADEVTGTGYARLLGKAMVASAGSDAEHTNWGFATIPTFASMSVTFRYVLIHTSSFPLMLLDLGSAVTVSAQAYSVLGTIFTMSRSA